MADIAFFNIPASGHTNPSLGLVRELTARGHSVRYYSYELYRQAIQAAGAEFIPCDAYDMELRLSPKDAQRLGKDLAFSTHVLVETTLALEPMLSRELTVRRPDCIIADSMALWGKVTAKKLNIPFISSTTTFAFNEHSAKTMQQSPLELLRLLISLPRINRDIKRLCATGIPIKSVLDLIQNDAGTDTIVYTSPLFQPASETFPQDKYSFVGPILRPAGEEFEKRKARLLYISMGTVMNERPELYRNCIRTFVGEDIEVIISAGAQTDIASLGPIPENIRVYPKVDQIAVLQKADAFISHCGMNSVGESLYMEVPLLCLPQTKEQQAVAHQVCALGAGIMLENTQPHSIRKSVYKLLSEPSYKAAAGKISRSFKESGGAQAAAHKVESIIKKT